MSDGFDPPTGPIAHVVVGLVAVVLLAVGCDRAPFDDASDPTDAAAAPDAPASPESEPSPPATPRPTPTPTETPTGPDDDGWAEHLGLTQEELEERRASDDFLEFAEPRRAREHPRFESTHGNLGLEPAPDDGFDVEENQWLTPLNPQEAAAHFLLPFRDTLIAEKLKPATEVTVTNDHMGPQVDGGYVSRIGRDDSKQRQILIAVAFYEADDGHHRGRVAMAAAEVNVIDVEHHRAEVLVLEVAHEVADVAVDEDWSQTWREGVADAARAWGEPREYE